MPLWHTKEPLIKSAMNRVAIENGMIARRTPQAVAAHRHVTGAASRLREVRHRAASPAPALRDTGSRRHSTRPRCATPQAPICDATLRDSSFAGGLRRQLLVKGMGIWARARYWRNQPIAGSAQLSCNRGRYQRRGMLPHHRSLLRPVAAHFEAFLASHPAKPLSRPCGT